MRTAQKPKPINGSGDYTNMLRWRYEVYDIVGGAGTIKAKVVLNDETPRPYPRDDKALYRPYADED